ncbi:MAG TPA: hypothetical protein VMB51_00350 [Solirubrobacteraceae bacterium]|nr:hypothetical protein [Solirubrobacteraceae bacterium]
MRTIRALTVGAAAIFGLSLATAASASAAAPEFGICNRVQKGTGSYANAGCTTPAAGKDYEWFSEAVRKPKLEIESTSPVKLETVTGFKVSCTRAIEGGYIFGDEEVNETGLAFTGCSNAGVKCGSFGAAEGEFFLAASDGELGVISRGATAAEDKVGLELDGLSATFHCGSSEEVEIHGSLIVPLKANKMLTTEKLKYSAKRGKQDPERFEGGTKAVLEVSVNREEFLPAGLSANMTLLFEQPVEVNSVV